MSRVVSNLLVTANLLFFGWFGCMALVSPTYSDVWWLVTAVACINAAAVLHRIWWSTDMTAQELLTALDRWADGRDRVDLIVDIERPAEVDHTVRPFSGSTPQ